jgi:aerobic-type carbon monoxide dehydrogenase small subunit (CoxS/CutS family)
VQKRQISEIATKSSENDGPLNIPNNCFVKMTSFLENPLFFCHFCQAGQLLAVALSNYSIAYGF